jgi:hypothetical protein
LGEAELDDDIAALDQARVLKSLPKRFHPGGSRGRSCRPQETDRRHDPRLLRVRRERPRGGRAAEKRHELAPFDHEEFPIRLRG